MTQRRFTWGHDQVKELVDIIHNEEGGKFWRALSEKDTTKNMEKGLVWNNITLRFSKVPTLTLINMDSVSV